MSWIVASVVVWLAAAQAESGGATVRVVSYNIHHGEGVDGVLDLERIAEVIRRLEPDVVCLQEVDRNLSRTERKDMPAFFEQALGMQGVFVSNYDFDGGEYGNATFVRGELLDHRNLKLPGEAGNEPRGCLMVRARIGGVELHVLNTHLALTPGERVMQTGAILDQLPEGPVILAGDLNEPPDAKGVQSLTNVLLDPVPILGNGKVHTSPSRAPRRRIDYVLASPRLTPVETNVIDSDVTRRASDHLPVLAVFRLPAVESAAEATGIYDTDDQRVDEALEN